MTDFREFQDGAVIVGTRYRVLRLVGVGGMGSVYEVEHIELGKKFVLKALLRELARREDLAQRLRNEWRALGRLQHPNIVNVTDAGTSESGVPYYVMERLDGDTLAVLLRQKRRLHVLEAVGIAASVLDALSAAHDIGIIHRDVKPANIFIVSGGGVKLLDFGIAKIADATSVVTARGLAVGTPRYMSPEQARGERVDGRSDIYASALILFEMIAGVGPFDDARDHNELLLAHLAREAPALSSVVMGVSPELERILSRMLAKDIRERPVHARDGAQQLREFAARLQSVPATDAPTVQALYTAPTLDQARRPTPSPIHESVTRAEGRARSSADISQSDMALTQRLPLPHETTQVTLSVNTTEAFSVSPAPNTTFVSPPPAFDGSTTLEMSSASSRAAQPAFPKRSSQPTPAPAPQSHPPVEHPERTEMLGELTPALPTDAFETNTQLPLPERARPISLTPPPVVDSPRGEPSPRAQRAGRIALLSAAALAVLATVGVMISRGESSAPEAPPASAVSSPTAEQVHAAPAAQPTASPLVAPEGQPAQVALTPSAVAPTSSAAESASPDAAAVGNLRTIPDSKRAAAASLAAHPVTGALKPGAFLRAAPAHPSNPPAAAKRAEPSMPGSGL